jgi:hypothetical protein
VKSSLWKQNNAELSASVNIGVSWGAGTFQPAEQPLADQEGPPAWSYYCYYELNEVLR